MSHSDLSALITSRICHDLISPIGAIGNGLELLSGLNPDASTPELDLISDSVNAAAQRLRLFRIAFGTAAPGQRIGMGELRPTLDALSSGRSSLTLASDAADLPRLTAKAALLALLCQERCLPLGGASRLAMSETGLRIDSTAPRLREAEALWALVETPGTTPEIAPAEVQFLLLGQLVASTGARFTRQMRADGMMLALEGIAG